MKPQGHSGTWVSTLAKGVRAGEVVTASVWPPAGSGQADRCVAVPFCGPLLLGVPVLLSSCCPGPG